MITVKDKVEQFKRDCKSYKVLIKNLVECDERLIEIANKLQGVSSVSPKGVIYENCGDPYKERKNEWLVLEDEVLKDKNAYEVIIKKVDKVLMMIDNPVDRNLIKDRLIDKMYYKKIVDKYSYYDISAIDKHIDSVLIGIFKEK